MKTDDMLCPQCETGQLQPSTFEDDFNHGDGTLHIGDLECYVCDSCGADPVFTNQIRRNQLKITDAKRRHSGLLGGREIRELREQLDLSQQAAFEIFGGGANAFSKYERGEVMQSVAMDRLMKCAAYVPGVLDFLRYEAGMQKRGELVAVDKYCSGTRITMSVTKPATHLLVVREGARDSAWRNTEAA